MHLFHIILALVLAWTSAETDLDLRLEDRADDNLREVSSKDEVAVKLKIPHHVILALASQIQQKYAASGTDVGRAGEEQLYGENKDNTKRKVDFFWYHD